jgi:predicted metal-dependent peptidase
MEPIDRIRKAHIAIMQHKKACAFAGILACGKVDITTDVPTAATNGWDVAYNPNFMKQHLSTDPELRFVVLHEAVHKGYRHLHTWQDLHDEDPQLANIAADYFVNLSLEDMDAGEGFIRMPKVGVKPDAKYRGWSVKQIFEDLKKNPPPEGGGGDGGGDGGLDSHDWADAKDGGEEAKKAAQAQAQEIERAIRQGEMLRQKVAGKGSGGADGVFGEILAPKVDWRKALREFIQETCQGRDESTWRKPNRRFLADDVYMPSMQGITMTELVVGFDTSGSVFGSDEMTRFVSEIKTIIEQVAPAKTHVIYWDTQVVGHQTFEAGQFAVQDLKPQGGGGTDGSVLFDYLREKRITPQAIVQFTDGYVGDWGQTNVPTLWAITTDIKAPFGTTVHLDV